jgi:hypothetical protein
VIVTVYASGGLERESIREYGMVLEFRGRRYGRCHAAGNPQPLALHPRSTLLDEAHDCLHRGRSSD